MTISSQKHIESRIRSASIQSPIAVFVKDGRFNSLFGDTIRTQNVIELGDPTFLGMFTMVKDFRIKVSEYYYNRR